VPLISTEVGGLGVLDDVTTSQVSLVFELQGMPLGSTQTARSRQPITCSPAGRSHYFANDPCTTQAVRGCY
jgi:hypothetical protein